MNNRNETIRTALFALRADLLSKLDDHAWRNCRASLRRELARIQHDLDILAFSNDARDLVA